ncbi:MAG: ANTAR domain-containing protein [Gammaproteobacteria bacterium]|nr:ANTAR domain-containing protein [Gammaproteobacteria bacterium]MBU1653424.1 ANTAR domain-containing protein [Gammaproteobacteria bacterium]MBU1959729.1 ANTAR domain-containing protein [Gammaproteobacteria bacterium]
MDAPGHDTLGNLRLVQSTLPCPLVMFSQDGDRETIRRAVLAGVSVYVVGGVQPKRVRPILDAAIARFEQFRDLSRELDKTRTQLQERKVIKRAKGLIMAHRNLSEPEVYQLLRKAAMDRNLRMAEVAEQIIAAADLLGTAG